ncbi:hypothetical protein HB904_03995 [Listeria booriae]|uniref:Uncharacterized protein n=1 Tax=Listeria booriae TaxID=1552123 RepID=A0A842AEN7_9LIST|nr:hypothetical protein [Listeria booriae]MBC1615334.1 hypothetical protein [Listeria booriae]
MKLITTVIYDNGITSTYESDYMSELVTGLDDAIATVRGVYTDGVAGCISLPTTNKESGTIINIAKTVSVTFELKEVIAERYPGMYR